MAQTLAMFWLRRFGLVSAVAFLCLLGVEWLQRDTAGIALWPVVAWSTVTAVIAASVATYWGYRIRCKLVLKPANRVDESERYAEQGKQDARHLNGP
jgi:membrane protein DedA with SNARE-associated domain